MNSLVENWKAYLEELVDPSSIDLSSFAIKDQLNPQVWVGGRLRPEVKERLIEIANDFFEALELPDVELKDITFTGSLANFTWSQFSDIDLHLIVDFNEVDTNVELVKNWLDQARAVWNKSHDIEIGGHEVEIYVQNETEPHISTGVYSVLNDAWLTKPDKEKPTVKWDEVQEKAASLMNEIEEVEKMFSSGETEAALEYAERLKEKIRKFRKSGLEKGGEFSVENIAFKTLRRNGYLEKLSKLKDDAYDQNMSLQESRKWQSFMNEAAVTPEQIPQGWKFTIKEQPNRVVVVLKDHRDKGVGKVLIQNDTRLPCIDALSVLSSYAPKGYGPLLYDLAMELSGDRGIYSDRTSVSDQAQKIWEYYEHHRSDVESFHPLELIDTTESECVEDITFMFGEEWEDDPLSKVYKKKTDKLATLEALRTANKITFV